MKEALLYKKIENQGVVCGLCAHNCTLKPGQTGICRVRKNSGGTLYSLNYDRVAATHADPIEKKPLYHFQPGTTSYSVATMGCNFSCKFCQNHSLSVVRGENNIYGEVISPEQLVATALQYESDSISYTYSEPTIYFELMVETAALAQEQGLKNVMVTNGYMSSEALDKMAPYLDGANVDLKAFSDDFYKKYCGARLAPVLGTIERMREKGIWIEITTLLIPGLNTDKEELKELISFISQLDKQIPWHVSRFFPQHQMVDVPITPTDSIYQALEKAGEAGLEYLYGGNIAGDSWSDTRCPSCNSLLIERSGYVTSVRGLVSGVCVECGHAVPGVWQ